jgi:hypothetical protein
MIQPDITQGGEHRAQIQFAKPLGPWRLADYDFSARPGIGGALSASSPCRPYQVRPPTSFSSVFRTPGSQCA